VKRSKIEKKLIMNKLLIGLCFMSLVACKKEKTTTTTAENFAVNIGISNKVGTANFIANTNFTNPFGEQFKLTKFQYYISNVFLLKQGSTLIHPETESYHLIKAENGNTNFSFNIKNKDVNQIKFLIGVDSTRNVSGAQTGALDPLNGMFWTWSSGYIMAKMEGTSPVSNAVSNLVTYHIGGFTGVNSSLRWVTLNIPPSAFVNNAFNINLQCDINKFFNGVHAMKIVDEPIMMNHGVASAKYADNYATMFTIQ
jgi:hypothetical protein